MDSQREMLYELLASVGVKGDNLYRLIENPQLTLAKAQAEWELIGREKSAGGIVTDPVGLYVHRLGKRFGVDVHAKKRGNLSEDVLGLTQLRKNRGFPS